MTEYPNTVDVTDLTKRIVREVSAVMNRLPESEHGRVTIIVSPWAYVCLHIQQLNRAMVVVGDTGDRDFVVRLAEVKT